MAKIYNKVAFDYGSPVSAGYQVVEDGYEIALLDGAGQPIALEPAYGYYVTDADVEAPEWAGE